MVDHVSQRTRCQDFRNCDGMEDGGRIGNLKTLVWIRVKERIYSPPPLKKSNVDVIMSWSIFIWSIFGKLIYYTSKVFISYIPFTTEGIIKAIDTSNKEENVSWPQGRTVLNHKRYLKWNTPTYHGKCAGRGQMLDYGDALKEIVAKEESWMGQFL